MIWHILYHYVVTNFGNPSAIAETTWSFTVMVILSGISDSIVRGIYVFRIWKLSKNRILLALLMFNIVNNFTANVGTTSVGMHIKTFEGYRTISWAIYWTLSAITVTDALMAATLCILLGISSKRSKSILRTLMLYCVSTGALTTICTLLALITFAVLRNNLVFIGLSFLLEKLYLNAILVTLNIRDQLRKRLHRSSVIEVASISKSQGSKETSVSSEVLESRKGIQDRDIDLSKASGSL